jgi:DNA polymerase III epsilon subunit-like protein
MHLKQTILALLSPEALKEVCGHLDVDLNCRTKAAMVRHLLQESISAELLLPLLSEAELQAVCTACGAPATGRKATLVKRLVKQARGPAFAALDFETADYPRDSACALGLVRVENHRIVRRTYHLIRPPRRRFAFTYLHGITWEDVAQQPTFADLWPSLTPFLEGADFLAAHNALFDRSVLQRCCETAGLTPRGFPLNARCAWRGKPGISSPPS